MPGGQKPTYGSNGVLGYQNRSLVHPRSIAQRRDVTRSTKPLGQAGSGLGCYRGSFW